MSASEDEQRTDLADELIDELDDAVVRISRMLSSRRFGVECGPDSLTLPQAMLLRAITAHGTANMSEVAALLSIKPPAASAVIAQLEQEGYVQRQTDPDDRRVTLVHLTAEGTAALRSVEEQRRTVMRGFLAVLDKKDIRELIRIHRVIMTAMNEGRA